MQLLTAAGVRDTGIAFICAVIQKIRNSIIFLRKQYERDSLDHINKGNQSSGPTLLICAIRNNEYRFAPKLVRWLLDAGASTTAKVTMEDPDGYEVYRGTAQECMRSERATQVVGENGGRLDAIGRLLLQEDAVHANSWLWPQNSSRKDSGRITTMALVRRNCRATSRVVMGGLFRYSGKPDVKK